MDSFEDDNLNEDFISDIKKFRKITKDDILDETYKKAEVSKRVQPKEEKKPFKKPYLKLGFFLIIISILSLIFITYSPWIYIKYDAEYGTIQQFFNRDFTNGKYYKEIDYIFQSACTNCSNSSKNFIGIIKNDFIDIPRLTSYAFILLLTLGIIFTIFEIIERKRNYNTEKVAFVHSTFAIFSLVISFYLLILIIKFFSVYFLLYYNQSFIEAVYVKNIILVFPVITILFIILFLISIVSIIVMKINFSYFEKKYITEKISSTLTNFKLGNKS